jgi:TolA-binding protein
MLMRRAGRTLIATLLCGGLAALAASPMALAQNRGNSGLPAGSGNPVATLQQKIDALEQQMSALYALQGQVGSLTTQLQTLTSQVPNGGTAERLAVYDSNEQKVGDVVGIQDNVPWVSMSVNNRSFVLQVLPQQLVGQFLWFGASNCTGPNVYISGMGLSRGANVFALAAVREPDGMVYVAEPNTPPAMQMVASVLDERGVCTSFMAGNRSVVPASPVATLNFRRPYTVH